MAITSNAFKVAQRIEARGPAVEREVVAALDRQSQMLARVMRAKAPKFQTALTDSIKVDAPTEFSRVIAPHVAHGVYQELGIAPGGKGLPRFSDPAAAPIVAWLKSKAFTGHAPRRGSRKLVTQNLELRDRYEGLAWHVRHSGMKASPFVKPTFDEQRNNVAEALRRAVAKGMAADDQAGSVA